MNKFLYYNELICYYKLEILVSAIINLSYLSAKVIIVHAIKGTVNWISVGLSVYWLAVKACPIKKDSGMVVSCFRELGNKGSMGRRRKILMEKSESSTHVLWLVLRSQCLLPSNLINALVIAMSWLWSSLILLQKFSYHMPN